MQFTNAFKLILPAAFFGYAGYANLSLTQAEVDRPDFARFFNGDVTQEIDGIYRDNLPHREAAIGWIGAARYALLNEGRSGVVSGNDGWLFSDEEFRKADFSTESVQDTLSLIASVDETLGNLGAKLVIVPLPAKVDINHESASDPEKSTEMALFYGELLVSLKAEDIAFVDTKPALSELERAFFKTDTHWTSEAADAVAQILTASGEVPVGEAAFTKVEVETVSFTGDLVSFVTSDELAPIVGLDAETVQTYSAVAQKDHASGALDLFGSSGPVPYALVGTSYSANENWGFVEALKLSLSHDVLNFAEEGQGPIAPMRAYLEQIESGDIPEVVIWEIPVRYLTDPEILKANVG